MATGLFNLKQVNQAISQGAWSGYIAPKWVEYLVVAGGGGGGTTGGGGGAGGVLTGIVTVAAGSSYTVTVGTGGAGSTNFNATGASGVASVFGSISATGGGGAGSNAPVSGVSGGSGGGAGSSGFLGTGGQGVTGQGNSGSFNSILASNYGAGGGGGAGTVGLNGLSSAGGNGGAGIASAISGLVSTYAGGGGGGSQGGTAGVGGVGGGGSGTNSLTTGTAGGGNTGGGGGGGGYSSATYGNGGNGGSGIVVVRYPGSVQFFTGGTLSYANGYIIHTFYANGTLAPTAPTPYVTDYQISRSLRFNSADSAYLNRTPATTTNQKTWTFSAWIKRSKLSTNQRIFQAREATTGNQFFLRFSSDNTIFITGSSGAFELQTTQLFRDPSAWYHIVFACDTTQATSSNRFKLYINGSQVTAFGTATYPSQNLDTTINSAFPHGLGAENSGPSELYDGYMTEVNFIDGQALTPSSFGYTNPATGVWSPLKFVGTYGTNGFYLNFSDNSNTTAATLGKDYSGNGNNWTPNNFSVTAGAGNDSLVDSPTSYGTDTGVGGTVRGNYSTMNPLSAGTSVSLTDGNLQMTGPAAFRCAFSTIATSSSKWYVEVTATTSVSAQELVGIASTTDNIKDTYLGSTATSYGYYNNGQKYNNATAGAYGAGWATGDIIGIALDLDAGTLTFYKNGTSQGTAYSGLSLSLSYYFVMSTNSASSVLNINFGQRPFAYTAPSGFKALCTQNLPTPTIGATTATQAGKYFNPVLYTGTGATNSITGVGFQPDWVWIKARNAAYSHRLADAVRGAGKELFSNESVAETTNSANGYVSSFNSDGFSLTSGVGVNGSATTFVAWNWKANGAGSSNTAGSITSTASASTTSGFSVVTYTGTGANATVGHGLGVAPSFIIVKRRDDGSSWNCYHISLGASQYIQVDGTAGAATNTGVWNNTAPTTSVFSIGTAFAGVNASGSTHVAYCFAEVAGYSKFGSYTGNGSADGPFVYTGFRPAFFLVKKSDSGSESWVIVDTTRNSSNVMNNLLLPNTSGAEVAATYIDALSNGFKCRENFSSLNASGGTYIYMAFASSPFKFSLAR